MGSTKVRRIDRRHHLSNSRLQDSRLDQGSDVVQEFMLSLHIGVWNRDRVNMNSQAK